MAHENVFILVSKSQSTVKLKPKIEVQKKIILIDGNNWECFAVLKVDRQLINDCITHIFAMLFKLCFKHSSFQSERNRVMFNHESRLRVLCSRHSFIM